MKDYNGDMQRPKLFGHGVLQINERTAIWRDDARIGLLNLKVDDEVRFNRTAELPIKLAQEFEIRLVEER